MHTKTLVISDLHIPYQDYPAVNCVLKLVPKVKWDAIHLLGDIIDCYPVSSHLSTPVAGLLFRDEIAEVREFLKDLRRRAGKSCRIFYHEGNHEDRLKRYIKRKARALWGLEALTLPSLLGFDDLAIEWRSAKKPVIVHNQLLLMHGTVIRKHSAYTAKAMLETYKHSVMHGHTHRMGSHFQNAFKWEGQAFETGCLCSLKPNRANSYASVSPNWQHGLNILHSFKDGRKVIVDVEQIRIRNGCTRPLL